MEYLELWASDHRPIRINFALEKEDSRKGRFFFDKRMLSREGFEDMVRLSWAGKTGDRSLMERIGRCRRRIMNWKKHSDLNSRDKIVRLKGMLETEVSKISPSYEKMKKIKQELAEALREEELFWRQKCREEWLRAGDRNTKYFHNCVKGRRIQNKILMLLDETGQEHFSEGAKGHIAVEFFRDLFMSSNPLDLESLFVGFRSRITDSMNGRLTRPVSAEEIKQAAFSIKGSSAPGEDGLTGLFYQRFWHIVGHGLIEEIQGFFRSSVMPAGWNHTQISLIPKVQNPSKIHISDNIIIAHEMVHGLRTVDRVAEGWMAIKTDMSKAYDRVEWNFIEVLLEKMGFDHSWIRWVMACVSSVSFSVLLNGDPHGYIKPERGIRQGDPLSPFLFILCAEALVGCLNSSEEAGRLHGIQLTASCPSIHHLLFADDSLLLCKANAVEASEIMACLKMYGDASGQMINRLKSSVIFGSKVTEALKAEVKGILGSEWNSVLVRQVIAEEDVAQVLETKVQLATSDKVRWGLSKNGVYDTKSGYKLIESLRNLQNPQSLTQPPLEKQLWSNLWKTKAPPKLKHFLWRINSGALAVKSQLRTRGINLDPTCSVCGQNTETINHVLFHCNTAKEVWEQSNIPNPPGGWSLNSVFLNLYHLIKCSKSAAFANIYGTAMEEAAIWLNLHNALPKSEDGESSLGLVVNKWQKPPPSFLKCNVGSSWDESLKIGGGAWVVRNEKGEVLIHSRRSFSMIDSSCQVHLKVLQWAAEAMCDLKLKRVIMEFSAIEIKNALNQPLLGDGQWHNCPRAIAAVFSITEGKLNFVPASGNFIANMIASSVTRDKRLQSYVARCGPAWLTSQILQEASA
ncbi:hypothetical protein Bca4012_018780 [Brassica carinata]